MKKQLKGAIKKRDSKRKNLLYNLFVLPIGVIGIAAIVGSSGGGGSGGGGGDDDGSSNYAVNATLDGDIDNDSEKDFRSNDVAINNVGGFSFDLTAVDGNYTIIVAVQSLKGEPLSMVSYDIGADDETKIVAGGSIVIDVNGANIVYDAEAGSGYIKLVYLTADFTSGSFSFEAVGRRSPEGKDNQSGDPLPPISVDGTFVVDF
jgi:hypothetical protein